MKHIEKAMQNFKEQHVIDLTCSLIEIPSVVKNEKAISDYLYRELTAMGLSVEIIEAAEKRPNLVARLKGETEDNGMILVGHMDTVPPDQGSGEPWKSDPFKAVLKDSRIYGLGATDMKGGIAAIIVALKTLIDASVKFRKSLILIFCVDEENGSIEGMKHMAENNIFKGTLAMSADTTNMCLQGWFKGRTIYEIQTKGKTAHPSNPSKGINAINSMVDLIHMINRRGFKHEKHDLLGGCTVTFGSIQGGKDIKSIPEDCKALLEVRTVPGQTGEQVKDKITDYIKELKKANKTFKANVKINVGKDPLEVSTKLPLIKKIQKLSKNAIGRKLRLGKAGIGGGDIYFLWKNMGIPVLNFGPGDVELAHSPNEYVEIQKLVDVSKCYLSLILEFCDGYFED
jgi:succinyl-diaminopimelate desuccinylase